MVHAGGDGGGGTATGGDRGGGVVIGLPAIRGRSLGLVGGLLLFLSCGFLAHPLLGGLLLGSDLGGIGPDVLDGGVQLVGAHLLGDLGGTAHDVLGGMCHRLMALSRHGTVHRAIQLSTHCAAGDG